MIRLEVEPYCDDCIYFEPDVSEKPSRLTDGYKDYYYGDTVVRCKNRRICKNLMRHLKGKVDE